MGSIESKLDNYQNIFDVELQPGQSLIAELDRTGDTKLIWDRSQPVEVEIAKDAFTKARSRGLMAYKVTGKDHVKGEVLVNFDPNAERIILAPPLKGGSR